MINKEQIISKTIKSFIEYFDSEPEFTCAYPGRVNLIGEHLDYNKGMSISCGINRWIAVSVSNRKDNKIIVRSENLKSEIIFNLELKDKPIELWHKYVFGSLNIFASHYQLKKGLNIIINGNVPIGSGLSSSAALEVALLSSYFNLFNIEIDKLELAKLCQKIEHEYLLIDSGLLDQFSSIYAKNNYYTLINFEDLSYSYIENNIKGTSLLVINSMVKRELANSKYIERVEECKKGFKIINQNKLDKISESDLKNIESHPVLKKRFLHILSEYRRVYQMKGCIINNNVIDAGKILIESHNSLKQDYEVSCNEINFLIDVSMESQAWYGGRIMGGGFGGSTVNLVNTKSIEEYIDLVDRSYKNEFDIDLEFYLV
tara:strand:+ start:2084 stop:3202 length:1119 start_codon:yes stop_codon:yes gene_type:complete